MGTKNSEKMAVLSSDRSKWTQIEIPDFHSRFSGRVYLDGDIYFVGGNFKHNTLHKLDSNMEWIRLADMHYERYGVCCLELNGFIWAFGGAESYEYYKTVEKYIPKENKWNKMRYKTVPGNKINKFRDMKYARHHAAATVWNGKIIVCGGRLREMRYKSVECFDPENGVWTELPDLPIPLSSVSIVSYDDRLIVLGGFDEAFMCAVPCWS